MALGEKTRPLCTPSARPLPRRLPRPTFATRSSPCVVAKPPCPPTTLRPPTAARAAPSPPLRCGAAPGRRRERRTEKTGVEFLRPTLVASRRRSQRDAQKRPTPLSFPGSGAARSGAKAERPRRSSASSRRVSSLGVTEERVPPSNSARSRGRQASSSVSAQVPDPSRRLLRREPRRFTLQQARERCTDGCATAVAEGILDRPRSSRRATARRSRCRRRQRWAAGGGSGSRRS